MLLLGKSQTNQQLKEGQLVGLKIPTVSRYFNRCCGEWEESANRIATSVEGPFEVDDPDFEELSICAVV